MNQDSPDCFLWWKYLNDPILDSLIETAAIQNLDLSIAATRILQARAELKGSKTSLYPHIDGSVTYGALHYNQDTVKDILGTKHCGKSGKKNLDFFEIGFDAQWEIDLLGLSKYENYALKAKVQSSEWGYLDLWVTLSAEIARNYIELRGLQIRLFLLDQQISSQKDLLNLAKGLNETGFTDAMVLLQTEEQLHQLSSRKPLIDLSIKKTIHRLSILLGFNPCELFEEPYLCTQASLPLIPLQMPLGIPSELLRRRPDILKAERDLASASNSVSSAVAAFFPRLTLRGFIGDITAFGPNSFTAFGDSQILAPIFNSQLIEQNICVEKIKSKRALYEYQKTVLLALEESENAISSYHAELQRSHLLAQTQRAKLQEYEYILQLYHVGMKDYPDVLTSHYALLAIEDTYLQSQIQLLLDYISIYKILGGGWEITYFPCM